MANSQQQQAQALKDSYVKDIINTLGQGEGSTDPAVKMASQETASLHIFPDKGVAGGINDGDPNTYFHRGNTSVPVETGIDQSNPVPGGKPGAKETRKIPPSKIGPANEILDRYEGKSTGDYAFGGPNLAGALGMEQGQNSSAHINLDRNTFTLSNDGDGHVYVTSGGRTGREIDPQYAYPVKSRGYGFTGTMPLAAPTRYEAQQNLRNGYYRN